MSTKQAMWVHGTSVQAERDGYFLTKVKPAWGGTFRTQGSEWFHFAIPTPVIYGGYNSTLQKVFVLYKTQHGAKITALHIFDGVNKIKEIMGLQLTGNHSQEPDEQNTWNVNPTHIKFGLGLSINVEFGNANINGVPEIVFTSAGADFIIP